MLTIRSCILSWRCSVLNRYRLFLIDSLVAVLLVCFVVISENLLGALFVNSSVVNFIKGMFSSPAVVARVRLVLVGVVSTACALAVGLVLLAVISQMRIYRRAIMAGIFLWLFNQIASTIWWALPVWEIRSELTHPPRVVHLLVMVAIYDAIGIVLGISFALLANKLMFKWRHSLQRQRPSG